MCDWKKDAKKYADTSRAQNCNLCTCKLVWWKLICAQNKPKEFDGNGLFSTLGFTIQVLGLGFGALFLNRPDCGQRRYRGKAEAVFHRMPRSVTQLLWVEITRCGRIWCFEERQESDGLEGSSEGVQAMENSTR